MQIQKGNFTWNGKLTPVPKFLKPAFSKLKNQVEKVGGKYEN